MPTVASLGQVSPECQIGNSGPNGTAKKHPSRTRGASPWSPNLSSGKRSKLERPGQTGCPPAGTFGRTGRVTRPDATPHRTVATRAIGGFFPPHSNSDCGGCAPGPGGPPRGPKRLAKLRQARLTFKARREQGLLPCRGGRGFAKRSRHQPAGQAEVHQKCQHVRGRQRDRTGRDFRVEVNHPQRHGKGQAEHGRDRHPAADPP